MKELIKGKKLPVGTVRDYNGTKMQKTGDGWKLYKEGEGSKNTGDKIKAELDRARKDLKEKASEANKAKVAALEEKLKRFATSERNRKADKHE